MLPETIGRIVDALKRKRVQFLLFGMEGLNLHIKRIEDTFTTQDSDFLVNSSRFKPSQIVRILKGVDWPEPVVIHYRTAGGKPVVIFDEKTWFRRRLGDHPQATLSVFTPTGLYHVDIAFGDCGIPFDKLWKESCRATFLGRLIRVANKEHIVESKKKAGRDKDIVVLHRLGYIKLKDLT